MSSERVPRPVEEMPRPMPVVLKKKKIRGIITLVFDDGVEMRLGARDTRHELYSEGDDIETARRDQLAHDLEFERADAYLTAKLSRGQCSIGQARVSLKQKKYRSEIIDEVVAKFIRAGFLDDRRFAESYVELSLKNRPAGRAFLQAALQKKLVTSDIAREAVERAFAETDEVDVAVALLRKRWWRLSQLELETARQKGYTFLAQRSISYQASKQAFEKLAEETASFADITDESD